MNPLGTTPARPMHSSPGRTRSQVRRLAPAVLLAFAPPLGVRPLRPLLPILTALGLALAPAAVAPPAAAAAPTCTTTGLTTTCVFPSTGGEQTFDVPAGITTLQVTAIGSAGGVHGYHVDTPPGRGARVTGTLTGLGAGQTLYVEVGGAPTATGCSLELIPCVGGFNGGGAGDLGSAGGGASDVRTTTRTAAGSLASRLLVAGGGGGVGDVGLSCSDEGTPGGDAGAAGSASSCFGLTSTGGGAGSQVAGGAAGTPDGTPGALSQGGAGGGARGGGGGGGLYGGGGGGGWACDANSDNCTGGAGGGGGSSLVPSGGTFALTSDPPSVTISYTSTPIDTTAPTTTIDNHPDALTPATAASFTVHATDPDDTSGFAFACSLDGTAFAACTSPASYTGLINGSHTFKVHATDAAGNTGADASFTWRVDTSAPTLQLPAPISVSATNSAGAVVTYSASATDRDDAATTLSVTCSPASGATFPKGATTVNCTASDPAGNRGTGSFTVTVNDTTAPALQLPAPMTVNATSRVGAVVTYSASATDPDDAATTLSVTCSPASGTTFPIGMTTVTCTASDPVGNQGTGSFTVTVKGAAQQLGDLRLAVQGVGPGTSLADKLAAAQAALAAGNSAGACGTLGDFIALVQAQASKSIVPASKAQQLVADATRIQTVLGC